MHGKAAGRRLGGLYRGISGYRSTGSPNLDASGDLTRRNYHPRAADAATRPPDRKLAAHRRATSVTTLEEVFDVPGGGYAD
jgi:hypothetical protein